jgi:spore maturation protein CgeB
MRILFAAPLNGVRSGIFISNYYRSLARAAISSGHIVALHDTQEIATSSNLPFLLRRAYSPFSGLVEGLRLMSILEVSLRSELLRAIENFKPDVVFIYAICAQSLKKVIRKIRKKGIKVVMWIGLNPDVLPKNVKNLICDLDCVFCYDYEYLPIYLKMNCARVELVPMGVDIDYIDSIDNRKISKTVDVSFIGMIDDTRLKYLSNLYNIDLGIWSWDAKAKCSSLASYYRGEASGEKTINILKGSKCSINLHREFEFSGGNYRLFEIPACKALQFVDNKPSISKYFVPDEEIIIFRSINDLKNKIEYYLNHEDERLKIVENARRRVVREHCILDRFKRMERVLNDL